MERVCPKCGTLVTNDGLFCPECGTKLEGAVDLNKPLSEPVQPTSVPMQNTVPPMQTGVPDATHYQFKERRYRANP